MFIFPNDLGEQSSLTCDVCIIGSGAAGITLARELGNRGIDTLCISGGGMNEDKDDRNLYRGHIPDFNAHEPLEDYRIRAFGGSTTAWGGRLVPFDAIDFEARDFVPLSGWPIGYKEVARFYPRAAALCESPHKNFKLKIDRGSHDLPARLDRWIVTNRCERWSMPTNFAQQYGPELRQSENVRVLLEHHCVDVELDDSQTSVKHVVVRSRGGAPKSVYAQTFVLACGGFENPRLLLASRRQMRRGIGNQHDMVGRCYMGHIYGAHGFLRLNTRRLPEFYRFQKDKYGMYMRRRFWLTEVAQREKRMMNIIAYPLRPDIDDPRHGDPLLSLLYFAGMRTNRYRQKGFSTIAHHLRNVATTNPFAWASAAQQIWNRYKGSPRLPFLLPYHRRNLDAINFQSEHAPNRDSRLVLSDRIDEFGMPRLRPEIAFSEADKETVVQFFAILNHSLQKMDLGRVEYTEPELREHLCQVTQNYNSHAHHLGTTRMAANSHDGVVDADCRVHGIHNLYIAGSSVFATSGHANPTLLILALSLRLAEHLIKVHCDSAPMHRGFNAAAPN